MQPPSRPVSTNQSIDPIAQWKQLAQLGSYGGGQTVNSVAFTPPKSDKNKRLYSQTPGNLVSQKTGKTWHHEANLSDETAVQTISSSRGKTLQLGQQASGVLTTAIALGAPLANAIGVNTRNLISNPPENIFIVTLTEPLTTGKGKTVLDSGSRVVFAVQSVDNGIVNSQAVAVMEDEQEYPVAEGALQIRLSNGSPIIAQLKDNYSGEIARRDGATFVMGALGKVGELANRATSTTTFSGVGGVSYSTNYGQPNYVGAVLEGGFEPLAQQWQQRNQQAISERQNLSRLWWVDAGMTVKVIVTRSFVLGGFNGHS